MKRTGGSGMIAALILACLFATTMLLTLVMGARVYRGVQARVEASAEGRVGLSYITVKVHGNDHAGGISVRDFGGVDAVVLEQDYDGERYVTALYVYDGQLMELFCSDLDAFTPAEGTPIAPAQGLQAGQSDGVLTLTYVDASGSERYAYIAMRSEEDSSADE